MYIRTTNCEPAEMITTPYARGYARSIPPYALISVSGVDGTQRTLCVCVYVCLHVLGLT